MDASHDDLLQQINDETLAAADAIEADGLLRLRWGFICECGDPDCASWVELRRDDYAGLRARGERVLTPGHQVAARR